MWRAIVDALMGIDAKDVLLLALGIAIPFVMTLFLQPLVEDRAHGLLIRIVGSVWPRRRLEMTGTWQSVWCKDGGVLTVEEQFDVKLYEVNARVAGQFVWKENTYRILARRLSDHYITGTYEHINSGNTLHGAFQLRVLPNGKVMGGRWIGFNSSLRIVGGRWQMRRDNKPYPFEYDENKAADVRKQPV